MNSFDFNGKSYHVRERIAGDVIKSPRLHLRIIKAVYGDISTDDDRIAWEMVFIVREWLLRVTSEADDVVPNVSDMTATSEDIKAVWADIERAPVPFIEALQKALEDDSPDPN
jgi:hypothetical protein